MLPLARRGAPYTFVQCAKLMPQSGGGQKYSVTVYVDVLQITRTDLVAGISEYGLYVDVLQIARTDLGVCT